MDLLDPSRHSSQSLVLVPLDDLSGPAGSGYLDRFQLTPNCRSRCPQLFLFSLTARPRKTHLTHLFDLRRAPQADGPTSLMCQRRSEVG